MRVLTTWTCILFIFAGISAGCDDDDVEDYVAARARGDVDFTQYHTFSVATTNEVPGDAGTALVLDATIPATAVANIFSANDQARKELMARGLNEVARTATPAADLVVSSLANVQKEGAYYWACVPGQWWGYWGWYWDPCAWMAPVYAEYAVGTVALGLGDDKRAQVVFGGVLQGVADGEGNADQRIRNGVHEMFDKYYPVKPVK